MVHEVISGDEGEAARVLSVMPPLTLRQYCLRVNGLGRGIGGSGGNVTVIRFRRLWFSVGATRM